MRGGSWCSVTTPCAATGSGKGVIDNKHSADVDSTNRLRAYERERETLPRV